MSQRHRDAEAPVPAEAGAASPRPQRAAPDPRRAANVASQVSAGLDPADVHEPGAAWKPEHHHDPEVARSKLANRRADAALEAEDVEAAHGDAPGEGRGVRLAATSRASAGRLVTRPSGPGVSQLDRQLVARARATPRAVMP